MRSNNNVCFIKTLLQKKNDTRFEYKIYVINMVYRIVI